MDAAFTAEQDEIRRTLRDLLAKRCGPDEVKAAVRTDAGYDPVLWRLLAERLGLPGLAVPEAYGGVGCSFAELALACEEAGRALLPAPLLGTAVLAAPLIAALGTEAQRAALLPELAAGRLTATLAVPGTALATALALTGDNRPGRWAGDGRAGGIQARRAADGAPGWRLYGEAAQVLDGHSAGLLVVAAHAGGYARSRTLLFLVRGDAAGLVRVRQTVLDETRPQARVQLRDTPAELLGEEAEGGGEGGGDGREGPDVYGALAATGCTAAAALAAEAVGAAGQALARTVEYVKTREQFGRPIGSFQAVKHRLADLYVQVQAARSAAYYAAWDPAQGPLALAQALEALRPAAAEAVQLHGGIGFTWEHEAHLYFKRAAADELLFGPVHRLRAQAAGHAGLFTGAAAPASADVSDPTEERVA
ncbi:acyl-CoA/acyl-ACP dehydrogenase [Streptomyces bambusae]|uniref:acyl-CoA dehydrogenase family protein n=1 Tax=Streptomyces bambusae TaxID=1550616 RepID=UPI001CFD9345|nr:acyl-CoA dehydrogenase family protein [Streptomyces bambusae]MCB5167564.1 acyl-CoA/acyl-ACP dehydrogenase [Streptomyces bambusae]